MKAAVHFRVSTEEQRERQSIAAQPDFAEPAVGSCPVTVHGWLKKHGRSAT